MNILWILVFLILGTMIFKYFFFNKNNTKEFDQICKTNKVCTLYPDQINKVIAGGRNIVMFFYSPECDTSKEIKPIFERLCTKVKDTVFCQINCKKEQGGKVQLFHDKNMIHETSDPTDVQNLIHDLRLK